MTSLLRVSLISLTILAAVAFGPGSVAAATADELVAQAVAAYQARNYDQALALLDAAIEADGEHAEAYYRRGLVNEALDEPEAAYDDYSASLALAEDAVVYDARGSLLDVVFGEYEDAILDFDDAIKLDPVNPVWYLHRGISYANLDKNDLAIADYGKVIELAPADPRGYNNRGNVYLKLKLYDEALLDYNRALTLNPNHTTAYNNRGVTYAALEQYEQAIADYTRAVELNPLYANAFRNRGFAYRSLGLYSTARLDFMKAKSLAKSPEEVKAMQDLIDALEGANEPA